MTRAAGAACAARGGLREKIGIYVGCSIIVMTLIVALCLPVLSHRPLVAVGVWVGVVLARWVYRKALVLAGSSPSLVECVPGILIMQYQIDRIVPLLGSALVLFGYLAVLAEVIHGSWFPYARIHAAGRRDHHACSGRRDRGRGARG